MARCGRMFQTTYLMSGQYVDIDKVSIRPITKAVAREFIVKHHYSHRFSSCRYALGVYYENEEPHPFFGENIILVGAMVFGHPISNKAVDSIVNDGSCSSDNVLELTRLAILDFVPTNVESFAIGYGLRWLKKNAPEVKVVIAYSDPEYGHDGTIYQATNWYYQGIGASDSEWIHSRTVGSKFGPKNLRKLAEKIGHKFWRKEETSKHRYIYFVCDKREKRRLLSKLKLPILPYPEKTQEEPMIQEVEIVDGELIVKEVPYDSV